MTTKPRPSPKPIAGLESHLGFWLRLVSNSVSGEFKRRVEARGVTVSEWVVLRRLHGAGPTAQGELMQALGVTKGALSKIVARLQGAGLLVRETSPGDARSWLLTLSAAGRRLVPELAALADENDLAFFGHLDATERARLIDAMREIARLRGLTGAALE